MFFFSENEKFQVARKMYRKNNGEPKTGPCETVEEFFSRIEQPMDWVYAQVW